MSFLSMTLYWIYSIPNWLFGLLCTIAFIAFGVAGTYLTREFVKRVHREDHSHNDIVGYFLAAITVFYGVTLGLVAIGTWNNYSAIQDKVDTEAQNVASLYRDVSSYPEPVRSQLRLDLKQYVREVIDHSWPQQRRGLVPAGSATYIDHLQEHLLQYSPQTSGQQVIYQESYRQFNELIESRRARLDSVNTSLPRSMWWMVILGALVSITTTMFFDLRSFQMHLWMTALMSGLLGLMIFLIATLDNPFRGKVSVSPIALERVYSQLMR
ncbi:DUF4239 domain-containing protein [Terriglobus roseus]|nr:DUF4239 domain-containing protein [Terriglobus roseus]